MRALFIAATIVICAPYAIAAVEDDLRDGDKYFEDGDWKKAAAAFDRAIDKAPGQVAAEAYGKRAAIFIILKDFKGGLDFIAKAKRQYPNAPEVLEQEALILWESDRKEEAIKVAERVVKAKPSSFTNQKLIGEYYAQRDPVKTATAFEAYLQNRPAELEGGDVLPRIRLGFAYLANARSVLGDGDEGRAQQMYSKASEQFEIVQRKLGKKPNAIVNAENGLCASYTGLGRWDQAINVCQRIFEDPKRVDASGSVYYNLATAYLARKQTKKARTVGAEFTRVRKAEARGFMLIGDTYFEERDWNNALDQYLRAEKALRPNQAREQVQLSIRLGKTYRRLPAPPGANNPNLALAIQKLSDAYQANPGSVELAVELGGAYLEGRQDAKADALSAKLLAGTETTKTTPEQRASLLLISGKSLFNQKKLKESRTAFEEARKLRANDIQISRALVTVINEQAFAEGKDYKAAQDLLDDAQKIDPNSPVTLTNLAVLQIERDNCQAGLNYLQKLNGIRGRDAVVTQRLLARSYMCLKTPNVRKASEAFAAAESEAKKANAQLALAEIYTEWVPLTWSADINGAVDKLELAVQVGSQDPEIGPAAKRNLALALYMRGVAQLKAGKAAEAASDFDRATRDPSVLKGTESDAFLFSLALARLESGGAADAAKTFRLLAGKGNQSSYLKGPYAKDGTAFFTAYATYKTANSAAQREKACQELASLQGLPGAKDVLAACWESVAYDHWRAGAVGSAKTTLTSAEQASSDAAQKRRIANNKAVAGGLGANNRTELEGLSNS
ncbi:MAG TPA: tetratricopeptide repeat protein, partial [Kofleriaceae bacterium]